MTKKFNLYLGKAGQLVVMAEFLARGWNVATPEVDVGDDLFVIEDQKGIFYRVQVKTGKATERLENYSTQFNVPVHQLEQAISPDIYYVFLVRKNQKWSDMLIIPRPSLLNLYKHQQVGTVVKGKLMLYFSFERAKVTCSKVDFTAFVDNFEDFPLIIH
jgi:PD-(D/E)XK endonuclease